MGTALINLYASHVIDGKRTIEQVPESIRESVQAIVDATTEQEYSED